MFEINDSSTLFGVHTGLINSQHDRIDELNDRLNARYFPDIPLEPNFDPRPVPTKQQLFPIIEPRKPANERVSRGIQHGVAWNFNPATQRGPPTTFLNSIDIETRLRNQGVALQHGADNGVFVPSSTSELYNVKLPAPSKFAEQPFEFKKPVFQPTLDLNNRNIGKEYFMNHTRIQLRVDNRM